MHCRKHGDLKMGPGLRRGDIRVVQETRGLELPPALADMAGRHFSP
jgi:hypothetical protein